MAERLRIISDRVDDMPLLLTQLERMGVPPLLDEHGPTHGNWVGLRLGGVSVGWLTYMLSEADHRLHPVAPWARQRLHTLRSSTGQPGHPLDMSDDRLAGVWEALRGDTRWAAFEGALNRQLLRVYDLQPECIRLDSTTASGHGTVTEDGLCPFGHSKDHRPDWPQVKVMVSAWDPLGMPVATDVGPGQRADDPLYLPASTRVRTGLGRRGVLYVGDGKMGAVETRACVQAGGDYYLCPVSEWPMPPTVLTAYLAPVWTGEPSLTPITRVQRTGQRQVVAEGFERWAPRSAVAAGEPLFWTARPWVIRSHQLAPAGERALRARLAKAQAAVAALNDRRRGKRRLTERSALQGESASIVARYRVQGLLPMRYEAQAHQRPVRRYGDRPATVRVEHHLQVTVSVEQEAVAAAVRRLGWRVYATHQPADPLTLEQAVRAYRPQYLVERDLGRLQGHPLSLTPLYLERDDHATGLIRLLSVGLRVLTLLEFGGRQRLTAQRTGLAGL